MAVAVANTAVTPTVTATSITVTLPTGITAGMGLLVLVEWSSPNLETITTPSGWTLDANGAVRSTSAGNSAAWFYKIAAGGDANPTFTFSAQTKATAGAISVTGQPGTVTAMVDAVGVAKESTSQTTHTTPTITVPDPNCLLLSACGDRGATTTTLWTPPTGSTMIVNGAPAAASSGTPSFGIASHGIVGSGSRGGFVWTANQADAKAISWTLAIAPQTATSGQTVPPSSDALVDAGITGVGIAAGAALYTAVNEANLDTTTLIRWATVDGAHGYGAGFVFAAPLASLAFDFTYRTPGAASGSLSVELRQGPSGTIIGTRSYPNVSPSTFITNTFTATSAEIAAITDPTQLRLRFYPNFA